MGKLARVNAERKAQGLPPIGGPAVRDLSDITAPATREAISAAVDRAVREVCAELREDPAESCLLYAYAGGVVAALVSGEGENEWCTTVGSLWVEPFPGAEEWFAFDAERDGLFGSHVWAARPFADGRIEILDLSLRHIPTRVRRLGGRWDRGEFPPYLWCAPDDVPPFIRYNGNQGLTELMRASVSREQNEAIHQIASRAYNRLVPIRKRSA